MATRIGTFPPPASETHCPAADSFSLMRGGPFYRLQCRLGLARQEPARVAQRALMAAMITWLPLLLLSAAQGLALGTQVQMPFLRDFAVNARFLVALPLLLFSEISIDPWLHRMVGHFLKSGLVKDDERPSFEAVIHAVTRLRDRVLPEALILIVAFVQSVYPRHPELLGADVSSWHFLSGVSGDLSSAGLWFAVVSMPLFRFLMLRWLWRILLWTFFLWRVSRLNLLLTPTHPDRAAGLGFLSDGQVKFGFIIMAGGVVIASQVENALAYEGATLAGVKFILIGYCAFGMVLLLIPLLLLAPKLHRVKERGLLEYGALATGYTQMFAAKWLRATPPHGEALLGTADLQSLADLGSSFDIVREMRLAPIDKHTLIALAIMAAAPMIPVLLLATSAEDMIQTLLHLLV